VARDAARNLRLEAIRNEAFSPPALSVSERTPALMVRLTEAARVKEFDVPDTARLLLPLNRMNLMDVAGRDFPAGLRGRLIWEPPALVFPGEWPELAALVIEARDAGFNHFLLDNIGHLDLFPEREGLELLGGPRLYTMNSQAGLAWRELGLSALTLSLEDDRDNLRDLRNKLSEPEVWLVVYAPVTLLISRIPLAGEEAEIFQDGNDRESLRLRHERGLTILEDGRPFSLLPYLAELKGMGLVRWRLDLSGESRDLSSKILRALSLSEELSKIAATDGNFKRGLG
jgi:putative protease